MKVSSNRVCGIVPKNSEAPSLPPTPSPTKAPTKAPTVSSTKAPVAPPTKAPVAPPVAPPVASPTLNQDPGTQCNLQAVLGFPINDPDEAPAYGYHTDYMEVYSSENGQYCSGEMSLQGNTPSWCAYQNSRPNFEGASLYNLDDDYYDDKAELLTSETIDITVSAGKSIEIYVSHYFEDEDYWTDDAYYWDDHLLSAFLTVENMSNDSEVFLSSGEGWTHHTELETSTHIKDANGDWIQNPDYGGNFLVTISCDSYCSCESSYETYY